VQSIEVGINRVFAAFTLNQILVFDDLHGFLDELQTYSGPGYPARARRSPCRWGRTRGATGLRSLTSCGAACSRQFE
jgi:hypothetical protein